MLSKRQYKNMFKRV